MTNKTFDTKRKKKYGNLWNADYKMYLRCAGSKKEAQGAILDIFNNLEGKILWKRLCICVTESLCCTHEINTAL